MDLDTLENSEKMNLQELFDSIQEGLFYQIELRIFHDIQQTKTVQIFHKYQHGDFCFSFFVVDENNRGSYEWMRKDSRFISDRNIINIEPTTQGAS